jgi:TonB-linked SusC/RagA family outer membrane protein
MLLNQPKQMYQLNTKKPGMPIWLYHKIWLVMRLTTVILIASLLQVSAATFGQRITINQLNTPLSVALKEIRKQSGYDIFYDSKFFSKNQKVDVSLTNATLQEALESVFKRLELTYEIQDKTVVIKKKIPSFLDSVIPSSFFIDIRGTVLDEKGQPLIGATVKVKDSKKTVITNSNGEFQLTGIIEDAILQISFIGYKTEEIAVGQSLNITVKMDPVSSSLEQVMVTGYQTISKERATGSYSVIGQDVFKNRPVSNLSTALQGMVAGLQATENADGSMNFLIRGTTSLFADRRPLVVVDGFPISNSNFSDINPNDVESVTILKDAAAASIWGARSANGVIVVVTKKAKGNGKLVIQANAFTRLSDNVNLDQVLTVANSADHIAYERKAFENNWVLGPYTGSFSDISNTLTLAQELLYANKRGQLSAADMNAKLDQLSQTNNKQQIRDLLMQKNLLQQYNFNMQWGTDRIKTYTSVMYENNLGNFIKNGYDRLNLNFNNDFKLTKWLGFSIGVNLQYKKEENSGTTVAEIAALSPYELLLNPDGSYGTNLNIFNREQLSLMAYDKFAYPSWNYNLLQEVRGRNFTTENINARIQTGFNIKLLDGLTFDTRFQYEKGKSDNQRYTDESTFYVRQLVNYYTEYNVATKTVGRQFLPKGGILRQTTGDLNSYVARNQLNYSKLLGMRHDISAIAGMELQQYTTSGQTNPYVYGYIPDLLRTTTPPYGYGSSVDPVRDFLNSGGGPGGSSLPGGDIQYTWERNKYVSFYGSVNYTFDNKYSLSGSARSDAANFITSNPALRWSPLWSIGGKWNIKNESFMNKLASVDHLDLRLSYGKNGNVERSTSTEALVSIGTAPSAITGTINGSVSSFGNPSLRWEKTTTTNLGIDFALFKNRLFGSVDLYNKLGKDIVGDVALPAATGTKQQRFNNAEISNRGIEINLGTNIAIPFIQGSYSTSVTYAYNKNMIRNLYNPFISVSSTISGDIVGRPIGGIASFTYKGMVDGTPQIAGPNGTLQPMNINVLFSSLPDPSWISYEGTTIPPHTLGWLNNIKAGNFSFIAIFNGKFGGVYRNPTFAYNPLVGKTVINRFVNNVIAGDPGIPQFPKANATQTYVWNNYIPNLSSLVESSSYIECKELTLQFALPSRLLKATRMGAINVFVQARDLGLIWTANSKSYNPDFLPGTNRPLRSFTLGANIQL